MKNVKLLILPLLVFVFCDCKNNNSTAEAEIESKNAIEVELNFSSDRPIDIGSFVDSIRFIKLETTNESIIAEIADISFVDNEIFITDKKLSTIFVFDMNGLFLRKIHKKGRGPGEYLSIEKVMVKTDPEQIVLYDITQRKLIKYSYDGRLMEEIADFNNQSVIRDIIDLPDGNYLCYRDDKSPDYNTDEIPTGLWEVDSSGVFLRYIKKVSETYPFVSAQNSFNLYYLNDGLIGFRDSHANNIYHISNDSIYLYMSFKVPGKTIADYRKIKDSEERFTLLFNCFDKENIVLTEWIDQNNNYFLSLYDKINKKTMEGRSINYKIKSETLIPGAHNIRCNIPNILTMAVPASSIITLLGNDAIPNDIKSTAKLMTSGMNENEIIEMNPIIQMIYLK